MPMKFLSKWAADEPDGFMDMQDDPLSQALMPPKDESPEDRTARLKKQAVAAQISQDIDESIQESEEAYVKKKNAIKILLLGTVGSGKSTLLKNFQLLFDPNRFQSERSAWKSIIHLNLIGSIKKLLQVLKDEMDSIPHIGPSTLSPISHSPSSVHFPETTLNGNHRRHCMRLSSLTSTEALLIRKLPPEWRKAFKCATLADAKPGPTSTESGATHANSKLSTSDSGSQDDPTSLLAAYLDDILSLWEDPIIRDVLRKRHVRLEDSPGFFLNDAARVLESTYEPTDADIVRARVRTFGLKEHHFFSENGILGITPGSDLYIYEVGGGFNTYQRWASHFDEVQTIVFVAPLVFNQVLEEDISVNQLEESFVLWGQVCSSPYFRFSTIILLLNKMDILQANLKAGISIQKYVPSFGSAPNDIEHATQYFRRKFLDKQKNQSLRSLNCYSHLTSAITVDTVRGILNLVKEGILRHHLRHLDALA